MRMLVEDLPLEERDRDLEKIKKLSRRPTRRMRAKEVPFLIEFAMTAKIKEAKRMEILTAFDDITTVLNCGGVEGKGFLSLSQAFALLMQPVPFDQLPRYRAPLVEILDALY